MLLKEHYQEMYGKLHEASYSLSKAAELMGSGDKDEQWDAAIALIMGAKVKFADVNYGTHNIDPKKALNLLYFGL